CTSQGICTKSLLVARSLTSKSLSLAGTQTEILGEYKIEGK
ncbi:hypothetical protein LINGRAHAP2_LOCUS27774, partial [Linum grandiflorum]